jgi:hypothetical protein
MQDTIYLLNAPVVGFIDLALQKQDVTPLIVTMPPSWNELRTRYRFHIVGDFQLPKSGDLFTRKLWLGKTQLTLCSSQAIRPNEGRTFNDTHDFCLYGDNLHAIHSTHNTAIVSTSSFKSGEGNAASTQQMTAAVPATCEVSRNDAPLIIDDDWNKFSISFYGFSSGTDKLGFSIREFAVEKISL